MIQKFHCRAYDAFGTLNPTVKYLPELKEEIIRTYQERSGLRELERIFGVSRQTVPTWLKQKAEHLPPLEHTLTEREADDVLELDELWSFVRQKKTSSGYGWIAMCRRTRQVVPYFMGDRSEKSCWRLWS